MLGRHKRRHGHGGIRRRASSSINKWRRTAYASVACEINICKRRKTYRRHIAQRVRVGIAGALGTRTRRCSPPVSGGVAHRAPSSKHLLIGGVKKSKTSSLCRARRRLQKAAHLVTALCDAALLLTSLRGTCTSAPRAARKAHADATAIVKSTGKHLGA